MARKRIYELLNQAVLTVSDYFMVDKSGNTEAKRVSGQVLADFIHSTLATVAVSGDYDDLTNKPTLVENFTELSDAPSSYLGQGGQFVKVNGAETALEFGVVDLSPYAQTADLGAVAFSNDYNDLDNLPVISDTNVYNTNGTLTGNRTMTGGGFRFGVNNTNANSQFNIDNSVYAWGFSVFQNKAFEDAIYISSSSGRGGYFTSDSSVGILGINQNGANYGIVALGKGDGTGKALRASGEVKFVAPSASSLGVALEIKNNTDTSELFGVYGDGQISMPSIPTSSAGLSAGRVWNDGGTLKIV